LHWVSSSVDRLSLGLRLNLASAPSLPPFPLPPIWFQSVNLIGGGGNKDQLGKFTTVFPYVGSFNGRLGALFFVSVISVAISRLSD